MNQQNTDTQPETSAAKAAEKRPTQLGWRALGMILSVQALLLLLAWGYGTGALNINFPFGEGDTLSFKFASVDNVFDFSPPGSARADSLLNKRLANLENMEKFIQTGEGDTSGFNPMQGDFPEFQNPERDGGTALDPFFRELAALESGENLLTRVAHYGDSQIEGDRITMFMRNTLQQRFGGSGVGFVQLFEPTNHQYLNFDHSENWTRNEVFQNRADDNYYGMGGVVFRYDNTPNSGEETDTEPADVDEDGNTKPLADEDESDAEPADSVAVKAPLAVGEPDAYATLKLRSRSFSQLRLAWGRAKSPVRVIVEVDGEKVGEKVLNGDLAFMLTEFEVPGSGTSVTFKFWGSSPAIYGVLLDGHRGVQVDNFGIRGHGGNGLLRINLPSFKAQVKQLNTKLVILQFGGNAVPSTDIEDWSFYEQATYNIIHRVKRAAPKASIIVMSVSDAAFAEDGELKSYYTVPHIRLMQKRAAERANVAFFDLFAAMGGPGSIVSWVNHDPPYAAKDYAHFSFSGQRLVANMLMAHVIREYEAYLQRTAGDADKIAGPQANNS